MIRRHLPAVDVEAGRGGSAAGSRPATSSVRSRPRRPERRACRARGSSRSRQCRRAAATAARSGGRRWRTRCRRTGRRGPAVRRSSLRRRAAVPPARAGGAFHRGTAGVERADHIAAVQAEIHCEVVPGVRRNDHHRNSVPGGHARDQRLGAVATGRRSGRPRGRPRPRPGRPRPPGRSTTGAMRVPGTPGPGRRVRPSRRHCAG